MKKFESMVVQAMVKKLESSDLGVVSTLGSNLRKNACSPRILADTLEVESIGEEIGGQIEQAILRGMRRAEIGVIKSIAESFREFPISPRCCSKAKILGMIGAPFTVGECIKDNADCELGEFLKIYDHSLKVLIESLEMFENNPNPKPEDVILKVAEKLGIDVTVLSRLPRSQSPKVSKLQRQKLNQRLPSISVSPQNP